MLYLREFVYSEKKIEKKPRGRLVRKFPGKTYFFLSARVHPGESNASWIMNGVIDFLISDDLNAKFLRDTFVFKIIPM